MVAGKKQARRNAGKIVVTAHCDLVWDAAAVRFVRGKTRRYYEGNLDNLICVAEIFRSTMPRVKDRATRFYFTLGEETTMGGARQVMKREGKALYIPIDVTDSAKAADINVEWMQNVNRAAVRKALGSMPRVKVSFRTGHVDETAVYGKKFPTFSLNLPLEGRMHGKSRISFYKSRRFGKAIAEILKRIRENYGEICSPNGN